VRRIDPTTWPRKDHYAWFRSLGFPYVGVTVEVDVTSLFDAVRGRDDLGLFAAMCWLITEAANDVPQLRQRIRVEDGRDVVVEHDRCEAGVTLPVQGDLFTYACIPWAADPVTYARHVATESEKVLSHPHLDPFDGGRDDVFYLSCLPWLRFTDMTHPVATEGVDTGVRITWGKMVAEAGRRLCPLNIQAHHALVDGLHLGRFVQAVERRLEGFELG